MKIIREGVVHPIDKTWWHGRTAKCVDCGSVVTIEPEDVNPGAAQATVSRTQVSYPCPTPRCGGACRLTKDEARFYAAGGTDRR